jgi:AcrR family transcriptional regulator
LATDGAPPRREVRGLTLPKNGRIPNRISSVGQGPDAPPATTTRARLLAIAARLFRRSGYAATTTRELASELGIQSASLYYHIGSKEELLYDLSVASLTHIRAEAERAMAQQATGLSRLEALIAAHVETALADQDQHAAMLIEWRAFGSQRRAEVLALRDATRASSATSLPMRSRRARCARI